MDVGHATVVINKDSCHSVPLLGKPTLDLGNEPWSCGLQLINTDALALLCGCSKFPTLLTCPWHGSPWSSGGFSIQATGASWNLALGQLLWEQSALCHALHFGCRHMIQLVMPPKELCTWILLRNSSVFFIFNDDWQVDAVGCIQDQMRLVNLELDSNPRPWSEVSGASGRESVFCTVFILIIRDEMGCPR
jgi:hypothetical protein